MYARFLRSFLHVIARIRLVDPLMPLQGMFPVRIPIPISCRIRLIQAANIGRGDVQALEALVDDDLLDLARLAVADADLGWAADVWTSALDLDQHLRFVAVDGPRQSVLARELVAGALVEGQDRCGCGVEAALY